MLKIISKAEEFSTKTFSLIIGYELVPNLNELFTSSNIPQIVQFIIIPSFSKISSTVRINVLSSINFVPINDPIEI